MRLGAATLEEPPVAEHDAGLRICGLKPKPEFLPLFNLGELVTTGDSEFWGYGAGSIAISLVNRSSTYISTGPRLNTDFQVTP